MLGGTPGTPARAFGRLVRGTDPVFRGPPQPGVGAHAALHAYGASSRPADRLYPRVGPAALFDLRAYSRHGRTAEERRARHLSVRDGGRRTQWRGVTRCS